ncbi:MAG: phenylalanine--tRNA ligase subunit beta [Bacteroidetes bacterium]|nr:phenylalanine--tRNA ligase subunit beta [Bacteroidota bacterium]
MKISYNWLKTYIEVAMLPEELAAVLTSLGLEVEGWEVKEQVSGTLAGVFTGEVLTCTPHPNSDRLKITEVSVGDAPPLQVICGAPNVAVGQKVLVATEIKKAKIRGVESFGMICAEDELGIGTSHEGIMVLPPDTPVGMSAKDYLGLTEDVVFEIGLTPNRVDGASHIGVARDLAAWSNAQGGCLRCRPFSVDAFRPGKEQGVAVVVEAPEGAPRYAGLTLEKVKVEPSPEWLQSRLRSIGLRPINNVVDITNFVLHETGHPLHAFDRAHIAGDTVRVRYAAEGEKFVTLDGVEHFLSPQDLVICNNVVPMCLAGIFGGLVSGVTEQTTSIFLESAYFNPVTVRKSSKRHGLKTDASFRYERGADPDMVPYALRRAALLLEEIAGAKVISDPVDIYLHPFKPAKVTLEWEYLYALTGARMETAAAKAILKGMECVIISECDTSITVHVPLYRVDVTRPCDLAEEILRIWGYNRVEVPERVSASVAPIPKPDPEEVKAEAESLLSGNGFHEIMCNSLSPAAWYESLLTFSPEHLVRLLNPLSADLNVMRQTLILGGLEVIAYNMNRQQYDFRLFETGNVYASNPPLESPRLALWMTGLAEPASWRDVARPTHFFLLKGYVEKLLGRFGISLFDGEESAAPSDIFSEGVQYLRNGKVLTCLGLIQKKLLQRFGIKQEVYAAEICWDLLLTTLKGEKITCTELPRYPEVRRDLALVIDEAVSYDQLRRIAFAAEGRLLTRVGLFDLFRGDKLASGKKQYALSFVLQDADKTLTDKAVDAAMSRLLAAFEKEVGAKLR